jgi:hypothetical protein
MYEIGCGVKRDLEAAVKWYGLAAAQGDESAAQKHDELAKELARIRTFEGRKVTRRKPQVIVD